MEFLHGLLGLAAGAHLRADAVVRVAALAGERREAAYRARDARERRHDESVHRPPRSERRDKAIKMAEREKLYPIKYEGKEYHILL